MLKLHKTFDVFVTHHLIITLIGIYLADNLAFPLQASFKTYFSFPFYLQEAKYIDITYRK